MFAVLTVISSYIASMTAGEYLSIGTVWKTPPRLIIVIKHVHGNENAIPTGRRTIHC